MFFHDRIKSILDTDKVLEVGPGATPHPRSNVFLEKKFETQEQLIAQSGRVGILKTEKPIVYYSGDTFPFADNEFDYVICSHVLEHVNNVDVFLKELQRVAKRGYLEFPTIYYDYLYNFDEHTQFLFYRDGSIYWMPKAESPLSDFSPVQQLFFKSIEQRYYQMIDDFKQYFFQGFEWKDSIASIRTNKLQQLVYHENETDFSMLTVARPAKPVSLLGKLKSKLGRLIK